MRKAFFTILILGGLVLALPAMAEPASSEVDNPASLAERTDACAASALVEGPTAVAVLPLGSPFTEAVPASSCTATATCDDGSTRTCSGTHTCKSYDAVCPVERGTVECDGVRKSCPNCVPQCGFLLCAPKCGPDFECDDGRCICTGPPLL